MGQKLSGPRDHAPDRPCPPLPVRGVGGVWVVLLHEEGVLLERHPEIAHGGADKAEDDPQQKLGIPHRSEFC